MKTSHKICLLGSFAIACTSALAATSKHTADPINLVGTYKCSAFDAKEGAISSITTFSKDDQASDPAHSFGAYKFKSELYSGYAAAQGSSFAYYFENTNHKDAQTLTDRGVGIATITHDQDDHGKFTIALRGAYFQPDYKSDAKNAKADGTRGTLTCTKISDEY